MSNISAPVSHCKDCVMKHCPTCFTKGCQCDGCLIFETWLSMGDNYKAHHLRPFTDEDREKVAQRTWIDREVWLLDKGKQAIEEGCPSNPFVAGQWAERERIGFFLIDKLCTKENGCNDLKCLFIMEILEFIG